jgi:hypothetical protein
MHGTFEPYTTNDDTLIAALSKQGVPCKQIAEQVGRTYHSVSHRLLRIRAGVVADMRKRWTPEKDSELSRLWMAGKPMPYIASEMGVSVGSVAGRLNRLGLYKTGDRAKPDAKPRAPKKSKPWSERKHQYDRRKPVIAIEPAPVPLNLTFAQLEKNDCRFVVTDDHPMLFCGHEKAEGSSYCPHHHHVCWTPPASRNRDARPR